MIVRQVHLPICPIMLIESSYVFIVVLVKVCAFIAEVSKLSAQVCLELKDLVVGKG